MRYWMNRIITQSTDSNPSYYKLLYFFQFLFCTSFNMYWSCLNLNRPRKKQVQRIIKIQSSMCILLVLMERKNKRNGLSFKLRLFIQITSGIKSNAKNTLLDYGYQWPLLQLSCSLYRLVKTLALLVKLTK